MQQAEQIANQILTRLDAALAAATPAAQHAYAVLVRQQVITGWIMCVAWVLPLAVALSAWRYADRIARDPKGYRDPEGCYLIAGFGGLLAALFLALALVDGLPSVLNPEYGAIQQLIKAVR